MDFAPHRSPGGHPGHPTGRHWLFPTSPGCRQGEVAEFGTIGARRWGLLPAAVVVPMWGRGLLAFGFVPKVRTM